MVANEMVFPHVYREVKLSSAVPRCTFTTGSSFTCSLHCQQVLEPFRAPELESMWLTGFLDHASRTKAKSIEQIHHAMSSGPKPGKEIAHQPIVVEVYPTTCDVPLSYFLLCLGSSIAVSIEDIMDSSERRNRNIIPAITR